MERIIMPVVFFNDSDYITLPELKSFISEFIDKDFDAKDKLVEKIEEYANESLGNKAKVMDYFHNGLRYGKKEIKLYRYFYPDTRYDKNYQEVKLILQSLISKPNNFIEAIYKDDFEAIFLAELKTPLGNTLLLDITRKVYTAEEGNPYREYKLISSIGIIPEKNVFFIITKNKSNMSFVPDENAKNVTTNVVFNELKNLILTSLDVKVALDIGYENKLFAMVEKYTKTPAIVTTVMGEKVATIENVVNGMKKELDLDEEKTEFLTDDIKNIFEKYISINQDDKKIFIDGASFYVIQLKSRDIEQTTFTEHSADQDPIHCKMAFFNNKQALFSNAVCNEAMFNGKRKETKYYDYWFRFKILARKDSVVFKFYEYTRKEDIFNALHEFSSR